MIAEGVFIFLSTFVLSSVEAERNIVPSDAVCATFPNEEFKIDLRRCQNTCQYYGRTWDCPIDYKPNGDCYCKKGFARLKEDGKCVSVTANAACVAKLPIQPESCNGANEYYTESLEMNVCDTSCRTHGCQLENLATEKVFRWSPHCTCGENDNHYTYNLKTYKRLSNGQCVLLSDPLCVAEYQPSPERCAALGQIYAVNAPCQESCYGETYCPPPGPTCICPSNKLAVPHIVLNGDSIGPVDVITCYSKATCPKTVEQMRMQ